MVDWSKIRQDVRANKMNHKKWTKLYTLEDVCKRNTVI